jgi:hypothetical protein
LSRQEIAICLREINFFVQALKRDDMGAKQLIGIVLGALVGLLVGYASRCLGGTG